MAKKTLTTFGIGRMTRRRFIEECRRGSGRSIGAIVGVHALTPGWWGEGETKMYFDGDKEFPSYCGTGTEDYAGLGWGLAPTPYLYNGCNLTDKNFHSFYRWYLPDPIYWQK